MLTWDDNTRKDQSGKVVSAGYRAEIPGEMFLDCPALGIDMHPLGQVGAMEALNPAERALMRALKEHGIQCLEAMAIIGSPEDLG